MYLYVTRHFLKSQRETRKSLLKILSRSGFDRKVRKSETMSAASGKSR